MSGSVGIFGGTFDPPHAGHLAAAKRCMADLGLDRVLFVVANDPWQKTPERQISPAADRLRMVELALEGEAGLEACALEIDRGGPSYTIETVEELSRTQAINEPWVIVGADLSRTMDTWERPAELSALVHLAVLSRPGSPLELPEGWRAVAVASDEIDLSSSMIRQMVAEGRSIEGLVAPAVVQHIAERHLYA